MSADLCLFGFLGAGFEGGSFVQIAPKSLELAFLILDGEPLLHDELDAAVNYPIFRVLRTWLLFLEQGAKGSPGPP